MDGVYIYLLGVAVFGVFFYFGGTRGKASKPEQYAIIFGLLWPITLPLVIWFVFRSFTMKD